MATLSVYDYLVFAGMILLSSAIGIYYGYKGKQATTKEYLTANGNMHWLPVSISMAASFVSAIALMGIPSEVYTYGIQYCITFLSFVVILLISVCFYAPIFYRTQVTSANEYLGKRFGSGVRLIGCCLFILQYVLYLSVVLYTPSLALEAVAGVPMAVSLIATGAVCTFYTTLGGMRGVVWTDVFQASIMVLGLIFIIIVGTGEVNGLGEVIKAARKGKRSTLFNFDPDPTKRDTFWTLVVGGIFAQLPNLTTSQVVVQRFLSASSIKNVKKALYWNIFFMFIFIGCCSVAGLVVYAVFADCDPRTAGLIQSNDQLIPYFVVSKLSHWTCVPGLYTACIFSGALSTASSGLNSLAAVTLEDIVKRWHPNISDRRATLVSKLAACGYGVLIVSMAFIVSSLGPMVIQLTYIITGLTGSPNFAMFTLGMFVPKARTKGVYCGVVVGVLLSAWIAVGGLLYPPDKHPAPISIYKCNHFNSTGNATSISRYEPYHYQGYDFPLAKLYSISHLWYAAIGFLSTFFTGWLASLYFKSEEDEDPDPILLFDFKAAIHPFIPSRWRKNESKYSLDAEPSFEMQNMDLDTEENMNLTDLQAKTAKV